LHAAKANGPYVFNIPEDTLNSFTFQNFVKGLKIICLAVLLLLPWEVLDLLVEVLDFLWEWLVELLDITFEALESLLDHVVEMALETGRQDTQLIVFYILMAIFAMVLYRLSLGVPALYRRTLKRLQDSWFAYRNRVYQDWQNKPMLEKAKAVAIFIGVLCYWFFTSF
jgi:hypothetical protein